MSRIVLASNRVGDLSRGTQAGGLAVAVGDVLRDESGVWFGWSGEVVPDDAEIGLHLDRQQTVTIATQALTQAEHDGYYLGYSNRALWPVFHYRLDLGDLRYRRARTLQGGQPAHGALAGRAADRATTSSGSTTTT